MLIYGGLAIVVLGCSSGEMATTRSRAKKRMRDEREVTDDGLPNLVMLYRKFNEELFNNRIPSSFTIAWGRRMTRVSGVMIPGERRIKISLPIHSRLGKDELYDTIIHEMIHAFLYLSNVYHGHGKHFLNEAARIYRLSGRKITPWHDGREWWQYGGNYIDMAGDADVGTRRGSLIRGLLQRGVGAFTVVELRSLGGSDCGKYHWIDGVRMKMAPMMVKLRRGLNRRMALRTNSQIWRMMMVRTALMWSRSSGEWRWTGRTIGGKGCLER